MTDTMPPATVEPALGAGPGHDAGQPPALAAPSAPATPPNPPAHSPLRRNFQFQTLWAGSAAAGLGLTVADVAYPLAILALTGSPAEAGVFAATQTAGMIVAGMPAGHLVDRRSPRKVLIVAEICRALVTVAVAVALATGMLTFPLLIVAAVLLGIGQPITGTARMLLVRAAVPKEQLTSALTQNEVRINGADLAGPPLAGALYGLRALAHAAPFVFTAGSFVLSLVSALLIKDVPPRPAASASASTAASGKSGTGTGNGNGNGTGSGNGMLAGFTAIWRDPVLRAVMLLIATVNAIGASLGLISIVILKDQSVSPTMIGLALAGGAIGGLAGAPLVRPLHRLRPGVLLITVGLLEAPLVALLAVPYGPIWMAGLLFVAMLGIPALRVLIDVLILRQAPEAERGRMVGALMTLMGIGIPAGMAVGGLLLQYLSAQTTVLILAGAMAAGVLYCSAKPALWHARWPQ
jgi:MFS family permease